MQATEINLPSSLLKKLAEKIEAETGLSFAGSKERDLHLAVQKMGKHLGFEHETQCAQWLLSEPWDKEKNDLCAQHLTIGETYFFREPRALELVKGYARKKLDHAGARLRIWSAGCCTGEEPYSIAMALRQAVPEIDVDKCTILATDINSLNLQTAKAGLYRHWSFRNTEAHVQKFHFREVEGAYQLNETIRKMVSFSELNLAEPVYPSVATGTHLMDIIFCCNVLMYFSKEQARNVIERFRQCLVDGGSLIVSPSEASAELFSGFSGTYYPDAIYFQKTDRREPQSDWRQFSPGDGSHKEQGTPAAASSFSVQVQRQGVPAAKTIGKASSRGNVSGAGRKTAAVSCADQAVEANLSTAEHYHAQALLAMESGDQSEVLQNLRRALYLCPDSVIDHYLIGVVRFSQYKIQDALRHFDITIRLLEGFKDNEIIPYSDGWSAAHLRESVKSYLQKGGR